MQFISYPAYEPGEVVCVNDGALRHDAVFIGWRDKPYPEVIDLSQRYALARRPFDLFRGTLPVEVKQYPDGAAPAVVLQRALNEWRYRKDFWRYDLHDRNCQHFASFCATGFATSDQVEAADRVIEAAVVSAAVVGGAVLLATCFERLRASGGFRYHLA